MIRVVNLYYGTEFTPFKRPEQRATLRRSSRAGAGRSRMPAQPRCRTPRCAAHPGPSPVRLALYPLFDRAKEGGCWRRQSGSPTSCLPRLRALPPSRARGRKGGARKSRGGGPGSGAGRMGPLPEVKTHWARTPVRSRFMSTGVSTPLIVPMLVYCHMSISRCGLASVTSYSAHQIWFSLRLS